MFLLMEKVLQFYPRNSEEVDMISQAAIKAGFSGGLVIDYPNSAKAKKFYLVLNASSTETGQMGIVKIEGKKSKSNSTGNEMMIEGEEESDEDEEDEEEGPQEGGEESKTVEVVDRG